jgi:hypothetical protein
MLFVFSSVIAVEKPTRVGTTVADFLTIGFGSSGIAMGDAYVAMANDISSVYWNPAGLAKLTQNEVMFVQQPWIVDISMNFIGIGVHLPAIGTLAMNVIYADYGEMPVTTMDFQEGTGEQFDASDVAFGLTYARNLTDWFAVGFSGKYISSRIWHSNASALAADLGVQINTSFFSPTGNRKEGLILAMSISNYGTRMKYDGLDLLNPIDISLEEAGNFRDTPGQFRLQEWELPLIFRLGVAIHPIHTENHRVALAVDALHPNNNSESVNVGGQYSFLSPSFGEVFFRGGYKALFIEDSEFGPTFGFGLVSYLMNNAGIKIEYAFRDMGILGNTHCYGISLLF